MPYLVSNICQTLHQVCQATHFSQDFVGSFREEHSKIIQNPKLPGLHVILKKICYGLNQELLKFKFVILLILLAIMYVLSLSTITF